MTYYTRILPDYQLREWAKNGGIEPFNDAHINPASIDLCFGSSYVDVYTGLTSSGSVTLQPFNPIYEWLYRKALFLRVPIWHRRSFILASTLEKINLPASYAAMIKLKTTPCRLGLGHPIADWIDPGFCGQLTMMLHAYRDIALNPGQRICQIVVFEISNPGVPYSRVGHYQNQMGPTPAWEGYGKDYG